MKKEDIIGDQQNTREAKATMKKFMRMPWLEPLAFLISIKNKMDFYINNMKTVAY